MKFPIASTAVVAPLSKERGVDWVRFEKDQRKDDSTQAYLARSSGQEGVLYIGKAQEKAKVFRTIHKNNPRTGKSIPWISRV